MIVYLDGSDDNGSSVTTLAGYGQSADEWEKFEVHAAEVFRKFDVDILHATDFHRTKGCFKGWSYVRKRNFIDALYSQSKDLFGISHSVQKKGYSEGRKGIKAAQSMSPYGCAFSSMVSGFCLSDMTSRHVEEYGRSFVVESGHKNNREIEMEFHRLKQRHFPNVLGSISFSEKTDSRAIQLADLFAFYSRHQAAKMDAKNMFGKEAEQLEDKMFSLITSRGHHVISIVDNPFGEELTKDEFDRRRSAPGFIPPGTHTFVDARRPEDP